MLRDIDICFGDISVAHQWDVVNHVGITLQARLEKVSLFALIAQRTLAFNGWEKKIKYNHCGKLGHIKQDCSDLANRKDHCGGNE